MPDTSKYKELHVGVIIGGLAFLVALAPIAIGVLPFVLEGWKTHKDLSMLCFVFGPGLVAIVVALAYHWRCPACKGFFAAHTVSKRYSHTSTHDEIVHDSTGQHRTITVSNKVYDGKLACRRCGHTWEEKV